ncbi:MAG: calcineurin-like phosphoesterase family protein [Pirellulaceae bacterium]|nr:calcineurin-like phosphoesterase family protein [Pirellulaceae bacterium]
MRHAPTPVRRSSIVLILNMLFLSLAGSWVIPQVRGEQARGVVFHDKDGDGRRQPGEPGLPGIKVSNGEQIVATNRAGEYEVTVSDDSIVFVIKPSGWRTPISDDQLPQFFYIHKPKGSPPAKFAGVKPTGPLPKSIDFPLYPQREPAKFRAILFGDPQPRNQKELDYIAHDVVQELVGVKAAFGVTLGDIVFDDLSLLKPQAQTIALLGIPWYNVIGNHDINTDAADDAGSDETFEQVFGPSYYSFDYGTTHFLVLDDIEWIVPEGAEKGSYRGGFGKRQIEFIRNDLASIPKNQLVVLLMHVPFTDVNDRQEVYRLIEQRPFCVSVSGHTHYHEHRYITKADGWQGPEPHHHIINVTVSGSWWAGIPDERGIPHTLMRDGAPNGYSIISFDGSKYDLEFRASGRPADYQMQIHAPDAVAAAAAGETTIYANVFNGSSRSKVEIQVGESPWRAMQHSAEPDPGFVKVVAAEKAIEKPTWRALPAVVPSSHLWKLNLPAKLPVGVHLIRVRATDEKGKAVNGARVIRVVPDTASP